MGHAKDSGGVWGHSSTVGANRYSIFAVGDQSLITEKGFMQWCMNEGIGFKPLLGCYGGKNENSFIVNADNIYTIAQAGWLKGQESILALHVCDSRDRRKAQLIWLDAYGKADRMKPPTDLGVLVSVGKDEAMQQNGWTYDPDLKEYFICKDPDEIKLCTHGFAAAAKVMFADKNPEHGTLVDAIRVYLKERRTI
jgi:hypothetical protein